MHDTPPAEPALTPPSDRSGALDDSLRRKLLARAGALALPPFVWVRHQPVLAFLVTVCAVAVVSVAWVTWLYTVRLRDARDEIDRQRMATDLLQKETQAQRDRARMHLAQARRAVDLLLTRVARLRLAHLPQMDAVRREMLQDVLEYFREFSQQTDRDLELGTETALAYQRVGEILRQLGNRTEAMTAFQQAAERHRQLRAGLPAAPEHQRNLALCHHSVGVILADEGASAKSEVEYRQAALLQQQLVDQFPQAVTYRQDLATTHNNLGSLLQRVGRSAEAAQAYRQAVVVQQRLVKDHPDREDLALDLAGSMNNLGCILGPLEQAGEAEDYFRIAQRVQQDLLKRSPGRADYRQHLAQTHANVGLLHAARDKFTEAEAAHMRAQELRQQLVADSPTRPDYRQQLAESAANVAWCLRSRGQLDEAEKVCRHALDLRQRLADDAPHAPDDQSALGTALNDLASLLRGRNKPAESRPLLERAIECHQRALKVSARNVVYRTFLRDHYAMLAETNLDLKDHAAAATAARQLPQAIADGSQEYHRAAGYLARCAAMADPNEPVGRDYANQAMDLLSRAVERGFRSADDLQRQPQWAALRGRTDFRELLAALAPKKPEGPPK